MEHVFEPKRNLLNQLQISAAPFLKACKEFVFGLDLEDVIRKRQAETEPHRKRITQFEKMVDDLRRRVAQGLNPNVLDKQLREWVSYSKREYCVQMARLYSNAGFYNDASRVMESAKYGSNYTQIVFDEHGNEVGSETVTDKKQTVKPKSNAVQFEVY